MSNKEYKFAAGHRSGICIIASTCLMLCCVVASADNANTKNRDEPTTASIDSVRSWGPWELGIATTAGPQAPKDQVMAVRLADLEFRPNDNAAFIPDRQEIGSSVPNNPTTPPGTAHGEPGAPPPTGDPRPPTGDPRN